MTEQPSFRRLRLGHAAPVEGDLLPVGAAVAGTEVLLWDEQRQPVSAGAVGEIVLRSRFLSPGYWRHPELTRAAFLADPSDPSSRLFMTGDLGRLRPDGCLEHLGRKDGRLKIRGHRVEAADVEAAILRTADVRDVAVVARDGALGDAELAAFVVPRRGSTVDGPRLRAALAAVLPESMIPARFVFRAALPLLPNGKLDRRALSQAVAAGGAAAEPETAAADDLQRQLIGIWERFLGTRGIGVDDDFFDLGGNSLLAARIVARLQRELSIAIPLATLYQARTIERLAQAIRRGSGQGEDAGSPLVPLQVAGNGPPLFCVPGAGTDAAVFSHLALHLGDEQPLCALQWPGLCDQHQPDSVAGLAGWFLEHVRRRQPQGPYLLAGFSFGGLVAFEMAQQLRAQGQSVALLALFDTSRPDGPHSQPHRDSWAPLRVARRWLLPTGARHYGGRWTLRQLRLGLGERLGEMRFRLDRALHSQRRLPPPGWRFTYVRELCLLASRCYTPQPYAGALAVFRNERQPPDDACRASADLGWAALAGGALQLRSVPGSHGDALAPPHVAFLARELWPLLLAARPLDSQPALYV
jgi:thioesterase domain-containing protein/acyl carrier protein